MGKRKDKPGQFVGHWIDLYHNSSCFVWLHSWWFDFSVYIYFSTTIKKEK